MSRLVRCLERRNDMRDLVDIANEHEKNGCESDAFDAIIDRLDDLFILGRFDEADREISEIAERGLYSTCYAALLFSRSADEKLTQRPALARRLRFLANERGDTQEEVEESLRDIIVD